MPRSHSAARRPCLRYLSRYTHRVAISNRRLISADDNGVTFKWKDYRIEGPGRYTTMTLPTHEFIRRFLIHVLPKRFHRIRHYGLLANSNRAANIARARELLAMPARSEQPDTSNATAVEEPRVLPRPCPCCGGRMIIIETFERGCQPKHRPAPIRQRSGSTLHDILATDPTPQPRPSFLLALSRQCPRSYRFARLHRRRTANPVAQRTKRLLTPARAPIL